jgi:hypothetical protein
MNPISKIFSELTDVEVKEALTEIFEDEKDGIIRMGGYVRRLTNEVIKITNNPVAVDLFLTQTNLFREGAKRYVNNKVD